MKYTQGIRKIYSSDGTLSEVSMQALVAGFNLITFNGEIYHVGRVAGGGNVKTTAIGLKISDFEC